MQLGKSNNTRYYFASAKRVSYSLSLEYTPPKAWCPYIVVVISTDGGSILDLRKPDPVVPFPFRPDGIFGPWIDIVVASNIHRKQLLVSKRALTKNNLQEEGYDRVYTHVLCIYSVSGDGKVNLVKEIDTKEDTSPNTAFIREDGSIWVAWESKVKIYNTDSKVEKYDYPDELGEEAEHNVMGLIEHHGTMKFIIHYLQYDEADDDDYPVTLLYDTKTRQHAELPIYISSYPDRFFHTTYLNDSLQFFCFGKFCGSCSLDPIIQLQEEENDHFRYGRGFSLSPDGSRLLEYKVDELNIYLTLKDKTETRSDHSIIQSTLLFDYEEPKNKIEKKEDLESINVQRKKLEEIVKIDLRHFNSLWLSNDIIIATYKNQISILDFRYTPPKEGFKSFEVPSITYFSADRLARLTDTSFVVMSSTPELVVFKITV